MATHDLEFGLEVVLPAFRFDAPSSYSSSYLQIFFWHIGIQLYPGIGVAETVIQATEFGAPVRRDGREVSSRVDHPRRAGILIRFEHRSESQTGVTIEAFGDRSHAAKHAVAHFFVHSNTFRTGRQQNLHLAR